MGACAVGCTEHEHYGARLREKGINLSGDVTATRTKNLSPGSTFAPRNSWERGVAGEHRPDGSFMPLLDSSGYPMGVKERAERKHEIDTQLARLKSSTNPAAPAATTA